MAVILDLETDGLLDTLTQIFCAVAYDTETKEFFEFSPETVHTLPTYLDTVKVLSCHNGVSFDLKVLRKVLGYDYKGQYVDTVLLARVCWPDLENIQYTDEEGKLKTTRHPHSVEAWGIRFGIAKPVIEDYTTYTPNTLHRCKEDVKIQAELYNHIQKTIKEQVAADPRIANKWETIVSMETKVWKLMEESADRGWQFDLELGYQLVDELDKTVKEIEDKLIPVLPKRTLQLTKTNSGATKCFKADGGYTKSTENWFQFHASLDNVTGDFCKVQFEDFNIGSSTQVKDYLLANGWQPKEWNYKKDRHGKPIRDQYNNLIKMSPKVPKTAEDWDEIAKSIGNSDIALLAERNKASHRRSQIRGLIDNVRMDHRIEAQANTCSTNCVVAGTLIQTDTGNIPIEKVQKGDLVLTHVGHYKPVEEFIVNGIKPVFKVLLENGMEVTCTDNHSFWNGVKFIYTKNLKIGDSLKTVADRKEWREYSHGDYFISNHGDIITNLRWGTSKENSGDQKLHNFIESKVMSIQYMGEHPTFDITVAEDHSYVGNGVVQHNTSRMTHRIVVNIPKADPKVYYGTQMRSLFIASPGMVLVGADASALEARCEAHYVYPYDPKAAEELIAGDIHSLNAEIFQTTRNIAKNGKYAILYGCSPAKLASTIGKPLKMATEIYEAYWNGNPALKQLKLDLEAEYSKYGYLLGIDGRPLTIRYKHAIINTLFQSCGAIAIKYALCYLNRALNNMSLNAKLLGVFHDEWILECSPNDAEAALQISLESLVMAGKHLKLNVALEGAGRIGNSWADIH